MTDSDTTPDEIADALEAALQARLERELAPQSTHERAMRDSAANPFADD